MPPRTHAPRSPLWIIVAIVAVTFAPLLLSQLGFDFQAPAHSTGWAASDVRLRFDVVTLALVLFVGLAAAAHLRIAPRPVPRVLGTAVALAGLANAVVVVHEGVVPPLQGVLLGRAAAALALLAGALVLVLGDPDRPRRSQALLLGLGLPAVAAAWLLPLADAPALRGAGPLDLGAATLSLQLAAAMLVYGQIRRGRLGYLGRGLLAGLLPLTVGQAALMALPLADFAAGPAIAVLLQWFAWSLPATGLGVDVLLADRKRHLDAEKRFLRAVVDAIPHFVYARDVDGRYTLANAATAAFFGRPVDEVEGGLLVDVHPRAGDCNEWMDEDARTLQRAEQWSFPEELHRHDGKVLHVHTIKQPLLHNGGSAQVLGVSIDVTDRLRAERALAERLEVERTVGAVMNAFMQATPDELDAAVGEVLARVCSFSGAERAAIYRLDADNAPAERLFVRVAAGDRPAPPEQLRNADLGWAADWLAVSAPVDVFGAEAWPPAADGFRARYGLPGAGALLMLPITQRGRLFGFLAADRRDEGPWPHDTLSLLRHVADLFITVWEKLEAERTLVHAMEVAQASSRAKTEFLANMSHEIRTPMNCIIGITDLLREMDPSEQQRQYLEMARQAGGSLLTILNDILDISKIEAGQLELDPVRTDLRAVVEEVVGLIAFTAQSRGLEVVCRLAPGLPSHGVLDGGRLRQVLTNLLNNAAKFTRRGHIYLDAEPVGGPGGVAQLRFRVTDTGIGIPEEQMARIFDKFTQADAGTTRRFGGTGLGLAISRQLVALMGGELTAESVPEQGSTFRFTIPVVRPEPLEIAPVGTARDNVLIVAGHELAGEVLAEQARQLGCSASLVMGAPDALAMLAASPARGDGRWRAVLVDQSLPLDGLRGLADHCRALPAARRPRVLVMTDLATRPGDLAGGVDGTLTKPVRLDRLAAALGAPSPAAPAAAARVDAGRGSGARILLAEDNPFNQQVAVALLDRLGCRVTVACNGREAVDLAREQDFDLVFMDCQMPEMDGYEATRRIRALETPASEVTIVAMTANALSGDREACFAAGMDDFLAKPITKDMLGSVLKRVGVSAGAR